MSARLLRTTHRGTVAGLVTTTAMLAVAAGAVAAPGAASAHADEIAAKTRAYASHSELTTRTVGPARIGMYVGAPHAVRPKTPVAMRAHVVAPDGTPVRGAAVTFWFTPPQHPGKHIVVARAVTDAHGNANTKVRPPATAWVAASAAYGAVDLPHDLALRPGHVATGNVSTIHVAAPSAAALSGPVVSRVLAQVARLAGRPYVWGAAGPGAFDCSGLVQYVMRHAAGRSLDHSAQGQYNESRHIPKSAIRPGDLVFFGNGGGIYHVGIYAGGGRIWHAPHPGDHVRLSAIWTSGWVAGRVL